MFEPNGRLRNGNDDELIFMVLLSIIHEFAVVVLSRTKKKVKVFMIKEK